MGDSIASTYSEFERNVRREFQSSTISLNSRSKRKNAKDLDTTASSTGTNYSTFARKIRPNGIFTSSALQQSSESNEESESISNFDISSISTGTTYSEFEENMRQGNDFISTNLRGDEESTCDQTMIQSEMDESSVSTYSEFARKIQNSSNVLQSTKLSLKSRKSPKRQRTSDDFDLTVSSTGTTYSSFARNIRPDGIFTSSVLEASKGSTGNNSDLNLSSVSTTYSDFKCNIRQGQGFHSSSLKEGRELTSFLMSNDEENEQTLMSIDSCEDDGEVGLDISLISTASTTYSAFERNMGPTTAMLIISSNSVMQPFASTPAKRTEPVELSFDDEESFEGESYDDEAKDPDWKISDATISSDSSSSTLGTSIPYQNAQQKLKVTPKSKPQAESQSVEENKENQIELRSTSSDQSKQKSQQKCFSCSNCKKKFTSKQNLKLHEETHAKTRKCFSCEICEKPFSNSTSSHKHKCTHMNSEELKNTNIFHKTCEICYHVLFRKRDYEDHINSHKGVKKYPCSKCPKTFSKKAHADNHILLIHSTSEERKKIEESWKHPCKICNKKFRAPSDLERHKLTHSEAKQFKCSTCQKEFKSKYGLTCHLNTHNEELLLECEECDKKFTNLSDLKTHKLIHTNKRDFKCGQCEKAFTQKANLVVHLNAIHLKLKYFVCELCDASFSRKSHLKNHLMRVHE